MSLKVYNVMDGKKEEFSTLEPNKVKMYACGITVSDNAHIGHAYQAVIFDTVRKYLRFTVIIFPYFFKCLLPVISLTSIFTTAVFARDIAL